MYRRHYRAIFLLVAMLFGAANQITGAQDQDEPTVTIGTELVLLDVSVVSKGRPLLTLPKDRFVIYEDGVQQQVDFFTTGEAPASIVFVLDASGSMRNRIKDVATAAARVLEGARPGDEFAVVEFREEAFVIEEFTSDPGSIQDALAGLEPYGQTAMIDAVFLGADYAQRESQNRIRAVVLVTDGVDKNSFYTNDNLAELFKQVDVRFYAIGFTSELDTDRGLFHKSEKARSERLLTSLAKETGGQAFFPSSLTELSTINDAIASDLRSVYSIGYYPKNSKKDGSYRTVSVKVVGTNGREDGGLEVRTRTGYVASKS